MSVLVLIEAPVQPDQVENMKHFLAEILPDTRKYAGCQTAEAYFHDENPTQLVMAETWDARQLHEQYMGWRAETGVLAKIIGMLAGPPSVRCFEQVAT